MSLKYPFHDRDIPMPFRHGLTVALFFVLSAVAAAQGTPGGKTPIFTGYTPLAEQLLQEGYVRPFNNVDTFGWRGAMINAGKLNFTGSVADTPLFFLGYRAVAWNAYGNTDTVRPEGMKPIFDGKTLTGWTIRDKAEAAVVDGTIRLTNGSGSLESDGKYGDFVLQLEYFTPERPEGKGVNSGVFFRCIPGQTMNGYECQILNKPSEEDYTKFIGTDTGGIFRRQVGRNVGTKDGEWTYLTLAARGTRVAVWVNGIQVTDWTDDRAPHENPRNGCRIEAGTLQFQGHDPDTFIQFRNIRIREL
jgi:hypothetical protein